MHMLSSLSCKSTTMATSWLLPHLEIALLVYVHLCVYKWHYSVVVLVFLFLVAFFAFCSPQFSCHYFPFFYEAHLDTGIPANFQVRFGRLRPSHTGPTNSGVLRAGCISGVFLVIWGLDGI